MDRVRGAVIGYGGRFSMGNVHGKSMLEAGMEIVAACDLDAQRMMAAAEDFPGIHTYTSIDALLKDPEVDLCVVILPHNLHAKVAIQCSRAGKHVIVEKPMCLTVAEADSMIEASEASDKMLTVYHNRRWDGDFVAIRDLIQKGTIGEVFHVEACMGGMSDMGDWWRSDKAISGGAMYDWGAHVIDWCQLFIPDKIAGVDGYYHKRRWFKHSNEDHTDLTIRFEGGKTAQVEMSSLDAAPKARWRILGTEGAIVMENWKTIDVTVDHRGHLAKFSMEAPPSHWSGYYENIADHLMRGGELAVKPEEARRTIGIIQAAEESSKAGHTVAPAYS